MVTKQQVRAIARAIAQSKSPSLTLTEVTIGDQEIEFKKVLDIREIDRLMESDDFKLGWKLAHDKLSETIQWILTADNADLIRYAGKAK